MFYDSATEARTHRSTAALAASALLHTSVALLLFSITFPQTERRIELNVVPVYSPVIAIRKPALQAAPPAMPLPLLPPARRALVEPMPPPLTMPVPVAELAHPAIQQVEQVLTLPPPTEARPQVPVRTGAFDETAVAAISRPRPVPKLGSFDASVEPAGPRPPRDMPIQMSGFGQVEPAMHNRSSGTITSASFGDATAAGRPRGAAVSPLSLSPTEFGTVEAGPAMAAASPSPPANSTPLEILEKPRPTYSEEARKLRIEGVVVLEVSFSAAGQARVLRILRSLGHGLDESAVKAAAGIRFRPALSRGMPIDTVASVRIEFQVAY